MKRLRPFLLLPAGAALATLLPGCARVTLDQAKPLEINVNVRLQIDRELDEFFAFQKQDPAPAAPAATGAPPVTTQPATQPATAS
jgi:hypothetical protein